MTADSPSLAFMDYPTESVDEPDENKQQESWYVMRDLKRSNAKQPAYKLLKDERFEVFVPMKWQVVVRRGKRVREEVPAIHDLLFVHSDRNRLDGVVIKNNTLQYRYLKGGGYCEPMVVGDKDMDKFIRAVNSNQSPVFYSPEEITPNMIGSKVRIIGGQLDGFEVSLLKVRGARKRRIFVELPGLIAVSVEVALEYIRLL